MCGICGIYHKGKLEINPEKIIRMRDYMVERGPNTAGYRILPNIALGHRRLKIIDLSDSANQPMPNCDNTIWIVFNGEIYNFQNLRKELEQAGHYFKTRSDTEVLLHAYEQWDVNMLSRLSGMFAIAIYDTNENKLILCRDRIGKKPLYYSIQNNIVYFASDIKSIYFTLPTRPEMDFTALDCYLHHIAVPDQHSIFQNIHKVYPGTYHVFTPDSHQFHTYWEWDYSEKTSENESAILKQCENLLTQSILSRTISDVPIGVMLSGGVDSSIITAILSRNSTNRIKTFTVGFNNYPLDDVKAAREVSNLYQTDHTELILDYNVSDFLLELIWQYGEPFADSSAIPTYLVSQAAKEHITVMLTGDGGDEAFGGYGRTISALNARIFARHFPKYFHKLTKYFLESLHINPESGTLFGKSLYYINYLQGFPKTSFYNTMGFHLYRSKIWSNEVFNQIQTHNPLHPFHDNFDNMQDLDTIDQVLFVDGRTRLMYDYLVKIDRATMANSIEARSPFLDYHLLEYSAKIPPLLKFKKRRTKYLLKRLSEKYLPKSLLYTEKRGFGVPVDLWMQQNLSNVFENVLFSPLALERNYFNMPFIEQMWQEHQQKKVNHKHRLWALFWFELWHLMFIDEVISRNTPLSEVPSMIASL